MPDPQWTIDGQYRTDHDVLAWVCSVKPFDPAPKAALAALVRDAETLRQAREMVGKMLNEGYLQDEERRALAWVLDLLSSPAPQATRPSAFELLEITPELEAAVERAIEAKQTMTRRRVLYTLAALTAPILALWAQHARDHLTGWYDPRWRT